MAQKKGETRFIRKNGKVIPIKAKDPSKRQMDRNYRKYGDGANQAARIDAKYDRRASNAAKKEGLFAATGLGAAFGFAHFGKNKLAIASGAAGLVAAALGHRKQSKQRKRDMVAKENEYVATFGMGTEGRYPKKTRKAAKNDTGF